MLIVPLTIWKESRSEGYNGMLALAYVIHNRSIDKSASWPKDPEKVCLQRKQFSCWNDSNSERDLYPLQNDQQYQQAESIWDMLEDVSDPTNGATFYCNPSVIPSNPFDNPSFEETAVIGKHHFYRKKV